MNNIIFMYLMGAISFLGSMTLATMYRKEDNIHKSNMWLIVALFSATLIIS